METSVDGRFGSLRRVQQQLSERREDSRTPRYHANNQDILYQPSKRDIIAKMYELTAEDQALATALSTLPSAIVIIAF